MNKKIFLTPIKWYQTISKFTPASCRYYPTCSEYAKWLFMFDNPLNATLKSAKRIATCNQLFSGGIDYPKFKLKKINPTTLYNPIFRKKIAYKPLKFKRYNSQLRIQFWLVPIISKQNHYYILKDFNATPTFFASGYAFASAPR